MHFKFYTTKEREEKKILKLFKFQNGRTFFASFFCCVFFKLSAKIYKTC